MKVLFLTNIPSPYRVDFFQELGKLCDLTVLYELEKADDRAQSWKRNIKDKSYKEVYLQPVIKQTSSAWCPSVKKFLINKKFDIIVVGVYSTPTGMTAIHYMKKKHIPYWVSCDGGMISADGKIKYWIKSYFLSGADGYLSSAKICDEYLIHYGAKKEKIYRYPFTSLYQKDILKELPTETEKQEIKLVLEIEEAFIFLAVGQFIHRKGYDLLIKAAQGLHKNTGIYIVGGNPTEEYLAIKKEMDLENIHFVGFQDKERLQQYYRAADVFVFPTREDIWGLVINEAMASGLPVITTDKCVAGVELVRGNGEIIPAESIKELQKAMRDYEKMEKSELQKKAERSLEIIRGYSIEDMAKGYRNAFEKNIILRNDGS